MFKYLSKVMSVLEDFNKFLIMFSAMWLWIQIECKFLITKPLDIVIF